MLLSFRAANHRSLRDEQQLLLTPAYADDTADWQAVPVVGIFGANASGKSNVIDALEYMGRMVRRSFRESEPGTGVERRPFALDPAMSDEPSTFVVDLLLEGVRYTYGFAVDDTRVIEEWMYSFPRGRQRNLFHRTGDQYSYGEHSPSSLRQTEEITESNVLFLSVAARAKQPELQRVFLWFSSLAIRSLSSPRSRPLRDAPSTQVLERITALLRAADTGIESTEIVEYQYEPLNSVLRILEERQGGVFLPNKQVIFRHHGSQGPVGLSMRDQSRGTQALFELGLDAHLALDGGRPLVIDELDSSLHPFLTAQLIRLFRDPKDNPRQAQLLFTSHDATLLGRIQGEEVLHRDHVWFTEKDQFGATELFPLSAFKPRREENRERRYLAGRYGAVPVVDEELFAAALAARRDTGDDAGS